MGRYGADGGAGSAYFGNSYYAGSSEELLAGSYNVKRRRDEVMERLRHSIDEIERTDIRNEISSGSQASGLVSGRRKSQPEDIVVMQLRKLENDIDGLQEDVDDYVGPHFTRKYRTAQGLSAKLQTELDALDVTGRDDIRQRRKNALMRIDGLAKKLASQSHSDGKSCDDCEVQDRIIHLCNLCRKEVDLTMDPREKLSEITSLQQFNGSFILNDRFAQCFEVQKSALDQDVKRNGWNADAYASAVAYAYLRNKLNSLESNWHLMGNKTLNWLNNNYRDKLDDMYEAAAALLVK